MHISCLVAATFLPLEARSGDTALPETAGQHFKNIQILKNVPSDQLLPTMQFITASLGVQCEFCHIEGQFDKDDKKTKLTARKMIQLVQSLNQGSFEGRREITCFTCHRGSTKPLPIPALEAQTPVDSVQLTSAAPGLGKEASKASIDGVLARYQLAAGDEQAIRKITSRVQSGTVDFGQVQLPIEVFTKISGKQRSVIHMPTGENIAVFDGKNGWLIAPGMPLRPMSAAEADAAAQDADIHWAVNVPTVFSNFELAEPETIPGATSAQPATVIIGRRDGKPPVKFYFDAQSGLLCRVVRYADSALGLLPTQIDYGDYRDADGVQVPFRWTVVRPNGKFTIQVKTLQQNIPIDDAKFVTPEPQETKNNRHN